MMSAMTPDARLSRQEFVFPTPRERYGRAFVGSVVAHALVVLLFMLDLGGSPTLEDQQGAGGAGPAGGGGGGGARSVTYVALPAYQRPERPREQEQQRPVRPEDIVIPKAQFEQVEIVERFEIPRETTPLDVGTILGRGSGEGGGAGAGPGSGGGIGSGQGTGIGTGVGPGTGGGEGEVYLPYPRKVVLPPMDPPRGVKGKEFHIHFWVSASGRVIRVEIQPQVRDNAYRSRLVASLHDWEFNPAVRLDGTPVAWEVTIPLAL